VPFLIEERLKEELREPTPAELAREKREYGYRAERKTFIPTGMLRLVRVDSDSWRGTRKSWYERAPDGLEEKIPAILAAFFEFALELKARRAKREQEKREREEAERRRRELEEQRQANQRLIEQLETQAGAWYRARMLRAYLRVLRSAGSFEVDFRGHPTDFITWAERYVNAMDPVHQSPRENEFLREEYSWRANERPKEELARLSGHNWAKSWKLTGIADSPPAEDDND